MRKRSVIKEFPENDIRTEYDISFSHQNIAAEPEMY